jgi:hypothetical protein
MYHILNSYTIVFSILLSKMNYKIVKYKILVLIRREKTDVIVNWML